jgi:DNA-binding transcriptional LysR family regulator
MRIKFDIGDLEAFLSVAEHGSYVLAAEELNLSPSSVTRRIQKLEVALDQRLFDRTTRDVRLTVAGKQLFARGRGVIDTMAEVQLSIKGSPAPRTQTVTIACVPSVMRRMVPAAIDRFLQLHPSVRLRLLDLQSHEVLDAVQDRQADFGISYLGHADESFDFVTLEQEPFVLAVRKDHPLANRNEITWRELERQPLIGPWRASSIRVLVDQILTREGIHLRWFHEVRHVTTALILVQSGLGIAPVPESLHADSNLPDVVALRLTDPVVTRNISLVKSAGRTLRPIAKDFWNMLCPASER